MSTNKQHFFLRIAFDVEGQNIVVFVSSNLTTSQEVIVMEVM